MAARGWTPGLHSSLPLGHHSRQVFRTGFELTLAAMAVGATPPPVARGASPTKASMLSVKSTGGAASLGSCIDCRIAHPIDVIEVGYCADTRWKDTYDERKRNQHDGLIFALEAAGWPVRRYTIMLGSLGAVYKPSLRHLQELGLRHQDALALLTDLSIAAVTDAWKLIATRRRLRTRRVQGTPHDPG